jgi:hypothetical protein
LHAERYPFEAWHAQTPVDDARSVARKATSEAAVLTRSLSVALSPEDYDFDGNRRKKGGPTKAIVELTIEYSVPDIAACTRRASHQKIENGELKLLEWLHEN